MSNGRRFLEVLTDEQVCDIHLTALRVLDEVGLWLPNKRILEVLDGAGARVDFEAQTALIPPDLVEESRRQAPAQITWPARNPAHSLRLDGTQTWFEAPDSAIDIIDLAGNRRAGTKADTEDIVRLCDALPQLSVAATGVHPAELPGTALDAWLTKTAFTHSSKPVCGASRSAASSGHVLRMAEVVAAECGLPAGQLPLLALVNTVSPLFNTPDQLEGLLAYVDRGLPLLISPEVLAGASGPATLAGTLVQATAEFLGHLTFVQLMQPGMPVMYGCVSTVFDMGAMIPPYGGPEADLLCLATAQIARHYGIPSRGTGGSSDANTLGAQAGVEGLMSTMACIMGGIDYVAHGAGELANTLAVSYEKILVDAEIIDMARRLARGIDIDPETLGFEVIKEVGPRGSFLGTDHTARHFRSEQFLPELLVREKHDIWQAAGGRRMEERAADRAREILAVHEPQPLPEKAAAELQAICAAAGATDGNH